MHSTRCLSPATLLLAIVASHAAAAEIQLRAECRPQGRLVRLGDVAEIFAADDRETEGLAAIELCPAPAADKKQFVRSREIIDLLHLRGVNLTQHRLSGANQITVFGPSTARPTAEPEPVSSPTMRRAERIVRDAVLAAVKQTSSSGQPWLAQFKLSDEQVRAVLSTDRSPVATTDAEIGLGHRLFMIEVTGKQPTSFPLDVTISLPPAVVVTVRTLPRGATIHPSDVKLEYSEAPLEGEQPFTRLEDVVGKETARSLPVDHVLRNDELRSPLLVKKGEVVTVCARQAGLLVRTTGRARDDGASGDLITVESLLNRQTYFARVSGVQQVEVFARGVDASPAAKEATQPVAANRFVPQEARR